MSICTCTIVLRNKTADSVCLSVSASSSPLSVSALLTKSLTLDFHCGTMNSRQAFDIEAEWGLPYPDGSQYNGEVFLLVRCMTGICTVIRIPPGRLAQGSYRHDKSGKSSKKFVGPYQSRRSHVSRTPTPSLTLLHPLQETLNQWAREP